MGLQLGIWLTGGFLATSLIGKGGNIEINLPAPCIKGKVPLEECIAQRRSIRSYKNVPLELLEISQLLWAAQGITDKNGHRAVPSAGATYPLQVRIVTPDGIFLYIPEGHKIRKEQTVDLRTDLSKTALGQSFIASAGCSFIISAVYGKTSGKYGERAKMYVHMEAGHCAQNLHLQAVALGLGSVPVGAFKEQELRKLLMIPKNETPLYIIPVGRME